MGQMFSKKHKLEISEADRAVLTLKSQVRKLEQQRNRISDNIDREMEVARDLVAQGKKGRALLALKRRKLQEQQLARLDAWLINVEEMLGNIEMMKNQQRIFTALKEGNSALKEMQQAMPLEDVERLMQDSADAREYEENLRHMLGESLNPEAEEGAAAELRQLEYELAEANKAKAPAEAAAAPAAAAAAAAAAPSAAAAAAEGAAAAEEEQVPEMPSVPTTEIRPPAAAHAEAAAAAEEEAGQDAEPEGVLVAA